MKEDKYLQIFLSQSELEPNIKKVIMIKLKEKYLYREIDGEMITNIQIKNFNNLPLSNNLEVNILANITYKIYRVGDIVNGEIFHDGKDDRVFVLSYDIICEILNVNDFNKIKNKNNVNVRLTHIKLTNGCIYFLAQENIISSYPFIYILKMTYCHSCDKTISEKFIKKHNKSKTHLYFFNNFVINKYYIGDVLWKDFENIIRDYINDHNSKFNSFSILVKFQLNEEDINISVDNIEGQVPLYKFKNSGWVYYKFCQSKKFRDFVFHTAILKNINLESLSIINNVIITIFSKYKTIKRDHLLNQPRSILESKILK